MKNVIVADSSLFTQYVWKRKYLMFEIYNRKDKKKNNEKA